MRLRLLLVLASALAALAAGCAPDDPCLPESVADLLAADDAERMGTGLVVRFEGSDDAVEAALWFGYLPGGQLVTTQASHGSAGAERAADAVRRLEAHPALSACPALALDASGSADGRRALNAAFLARREPIFTGLSPLGRFVAVGTDVAVLAEILAYLLLLGATAVAAARARPREALLLAGLFAGALVLRILSAPRVPVAPSHTDMTAVAHWAFRTVHGLGSTFLRSDHPPTAELFHGLLFTMGGRSAALAFWATTVLGALTVVPVFHVASRLAGDSRAGLLAALALAAYPMSVFFSNGITSELPAGLLLALSLQHGLALVERRRLRELFLTALALALYAQTRAEAPVVVVAVVLGLGIAAHQARGLRRLLRWPPLWRVLGLAALLVLPGRALFLIVAAEAGGGTLAAAPRLAVSALLAVAVVGGAAVVLDRLVRERPGVRLAWSALVVLGAAGLVSYVLATTSLDPLFPLPSPCPDAPFTWFQTDHRPGECHLEPSPLVLREPGLFPLLLLPLWLLSLLPARSGRVPAMAAVVLLVPLVQWYLTTLKGSGGLVHEGARYHLPALGATVVAIGLGAWRLVERLPDRRAWRGVGLALAGAWLLSPVVTHRVMVRDVWHNLQREFVFAEAALARLPEQAVLLVPDHRARVDGGGEPRFVPVSTVYRTRDLLTALAWLHRRDVTVLDLRDGLDAPNSDGPPVFFYLGQDCYRVPRPVSVARACVAVREEAGAPLATTRFANRLYESPRIQTLGVRAPELDLALLPLSHAALLRLGQDPRATGTMDDERGR